MNVPQCCAAQFIKARERRAATLGFMKINGAYPPYLRRLAIS
jgi:hypothetical protein